MLGKKRITERELDSILDVAIKEQWVELDLSDMDLEEKYTMEWDPHTDGITVPSRRAIFKIPSKLLELTSLQSLNLSGNNITEIPPEIRQLRSLEKVDFSNNQISRLPQEFNNLVEIQELDLKHNRFQEIPFDTASLEKIKTLDLSFNMISNLPKAIGKLKLLTYLNLSSNRISELPRQISGIEKIHTLILGNNSLDVIPSEIGQLSLEVLDLSYNNLEALPNEFFDCRTLEKLQISYNEISQLPPLIENLKALEIFDFSHNNLKALPQEISILKSVRLFNGSGNTLSSFPSGVCALKKLTHLLLGQSRWHFDLLEPDNENQIQLRISTSSTKRHNRIRDVPSEIGELSNLEVLDLGGNELTALPLDIRKLEKLIYFNLKENPLPIPQEILNLTSPNSLFRFYFEQISSDVQPLHEAKILVVGQGSVGKTSLAKQLVNKKFDSKESKTDGIAIENWELISGKDNISVNLWDFGGQEIMHATHQFFLTSRSLYLLVLDSRITQEENRVEYWLKMIQSYGGKSPIIIVGNKIDQHPLDLDKRGLQNKYPNIKGFVETSCITGRGIDELKLLISKEIGKLPHIHFNIPRTWFAIKAQLENIDKDFISYDEYKSMCLDLGIDNEEDQLTLIGFLHDLGAVLNFRNDPRLNDTNILNPEWVTNGVYKILNSHKLFHNQGVLMLSDLDSILENQIVPKNKFMFIIGMMKKFEICYEFDGSTEGRYLIPDLLSREEVYTGEWGDSLKFEYHYRVLPSSIISRFIVRMSQSMHKQTVWRSGILLDIDGNLSIVKVDYEDKKLSIFIKGEKDTRRFSLVLPFFVVVNLNQQSM